VVSPRPDPGTRRLHRLEENLGAADVELSADELTEIEDAASKIQVQGGRYNEAAERMTNLYGYPVVSVGPWCRPACMPDAEGDRRCDHDGKSASS
jgi:hypothetical protein